MRTDRWLPAWARRAIALAGGWFWLPCPACGTNFAGYETRPPSGSSFTRRGETEKVLCPACTAKGMRLTVDELGAVSIYMNSAPLFIAPVAGRYFFTVGWSPRSPPTTATPIVWDTEAVDERR